MRPSPQQAVLVEEFMTGEEHSFDSVVLGGRIVWYSVNDYYLAHRSAEASVDPVVRGFRGKSTSPDTPPFARPRVPLSALGLENGLSHMEGFFDPTAGSPSRKWAPALRVHSSRP
jgi:hypothetical protein